MTVGGGVTKTWSSMQTTVAQSSGEAEYYAMVRSAAEALGVQSIMRDMGWEAPIRLWVDSSAAKSMASRIGLGKVRHMEVKFLWLQEAVKNKKVELRKIAGNLNPADVLTKPKSVKEAAALLESVGVHVRGRREDGPPQEAGPERGLAVVNTKVSQWGVFETDHDGACPHWEPEQKAAKKVTFAEECQIDSLRDFAGDGLRPRQTTEADCGELGSYRDRGLQFGRSAVGPGGQRIATLGPEKEEDRYTYPVEQSTKRMAHRRRWDARPQATPGRRIATQSAPMMNGAKRPGLRSPKEVHRMAHTTGARSPERLSSKEDGHSAYAEVVEDPSRMAREGLQP